MKNQLYKSPEALYQGLSRLRQDVLVKGEALYRSWRPQIQRTHFLNSALNMAFYLALRSHDLRKIQHSLLPLGLSSLGRGEARTITNLDAVMASLGRICQVPEAQQIPSNGSFRGIPCSPTIQGVSSAGKKAVPESW